MSEIGESGEVRVEVDNEGNKSVHVGHPAGNQGSDGNKYFTFTEEQINGRPDISGAMYLARTGKDQLGIAQKATNDAIEGMGRSLTQIAWTKALEMVGKSMLKNTTHITDGENKIDEAQYRTGEAAKCVGYLGLDNHSNGDMRAIPAQISGLEEGFNRTRKFVADYNVQLDAIGKRLLQCSEDLEQLQQSGIAFAEQYGKDFVQQFHAPMQGLQRIEGSL